MFNLDHPAALKNYISRGMSVHKTEEEDPVEVVDGAPLLGGEVYLADRVPLSPLIKK